MRTLAAFLLLVSSTMGQVQLTGRVMSSGQTIRVETSDLKSNPTIVNSYGTIAPVVSINTLPVTVQWLPQNGMACVVGYLSTTVKTTDIVTFACQPGWLVTGAGSLPAIPVFTLTNGVGGNNHPSLTLSGSPKTMTVGYNMTNDIYLYPPLVIHNDLTIRKPPVTSTGALAFNAQGWPVLADRPLVTGATITTASVDPSFTKTLYSLPYGVYTVNLTGTNIKVALSGAQAPQRVISPVATPSGTPANLTWWKVAPGPNAPNAPDIALDFYYSNQVANGYSATIDSLAVYPPNPSDPTNMTGWTTTPPTYTAQADLMHLKASTLRVMDDMQTNNQFLINPIDLTTSANVNMGIVSIGPPTIPAAFDPTGVTVIECTTSAPHGLFDGNIANIYNGGTLTCTDGTSFSLANVIGMVYPDPTRVNVFQMYVMSISGGHIPKSLLSVTGTVKASWGNVRTTADISNRCNTANANLFLPIPSAATPALIVTLAQQYAAQLNQGLQIELTLSNECWNGFYQNAYFRALSYRMGGSFADYTQSYVAKFASATALFKSTWVAAGRKATDVICNLESQSGNAGVTTTILGWVKKNNVPFDGMNTDLYIDAVPFISTGIAPGVQTLLDSGTPGQDRDWYSTIIDYSGHVAYKTGAHKAALVAAGYPNIPMKHYEGGSNTCTPGLTQVNQFVRGLALRSHPQRYWDMLALYQNAQNYGATLFMHYTDNYVDGNANGTPLDWAVFDQYNQPLGTGDYAKDAIGITNPGGLGQPSMAGGSAFTWNLLTLRQNPTPVSPIPDGQYTIGGITVTIKGGMIIIPPIPITPVTGSKKP